MPQRCRLGDLGTFLTNLVDKSQLTSSVEPSRNSVANSYSKLPRNVHTPIE